MMGVVLSLLLLFVVIWLVWSSQAELPARRSKADWWDRYQWYLQTPEWQALRYARLQIAEGRCEGCRRPLPRSRDGKYHFHAHHLPGTYWRLGHNDVADIRVLCSDCHQACHPDKLIA